DISTLLNISIFFFTYLLLIILGTIILLIFGNSLFDAVFQVISAIGTAGLQTMDLAAQSAFSKITLMILMLLGRLEIFPLLVLAGSLIRKR
ncbi:TrkH family potassium uptake protein, partial [Patescibacteria group bacterium]|nr:TrkH family potassium uptake protein [Patescibacteria group bacterium]MBU1954224.1 TrkH family potassium uptake protein [Patescibacteria group bacterium]